MIMKRLVELKCITRLVILLVFCTDQFVSCLDTVHELIQINDVWIKDPSYMNNQPHFLLF